MEIRSSRSKSCYIHRLFRSFGSKFLVDESAHSRLAHITNLRGGEPTLNEPSKHFRGENRVTVFLSQIFSCFRILLLLLLHFRQPFARSLGIWGDRWQPPKSWDLKRHAPWEETVVAFGTPFSVGDTGRDFRGNMWLPRMGEEDHPPGNGRVKVESFRLGGKSSRPLSLIQLSPPLPDSMMESPGEKGFTKWNYEDGIWIRVKPSCSFDRSIGKSRRFIAV